MPTSSGSSPVGRITGLVLLLVAIVLMAPLASYMSVAFGWTNPSQTPPGGSGILTALNGKLGINDANPQNLLSVNGTIGATTVTGLAAPVAGADATNKDYVDAQVAGGVGGAGGGGASMVLYGVGLNGAQNGRYQRPVGAIGAGCRGIYGGVFTVACAPAVNVAAGTGATACPAGWTQAYAGYGPMNTFFSWYGMANGDPSGQSGGQTEGDIPDTAVIGTDSICSTAAYAFMYDVTYAQAGAGAAVGGSNSVLTACNDIGCNTCRICYK